MRGGTPADITGQKFNRLTAIEYIGSDKKRSVWRFRCDCGAEVISLAKTVKGGLRKSCGCLKKERLSAAASRQNTTHGLSKSSLFKKYVAMRNRCERPSCNAYKNYGARGIKICDEWLGADGFLHFYHWAMESGYNDFAIGSCTIERIDNNGPYAPWNCRWATRKEQANNTRKNVFLTYNGKTQTLAMWSEETGLVDETIRYRINHGWTVEEALTIPPYYHRRNGKNHI